VSSLDDPKRWAELDPQNMRSLLSAFPKQIREAWHLVQGLELKVDFPIASVLVSGLGGSAIGGDVVRTVTAHVLRVPLLVIRDYGLPQFVNSKTVVFACSYSGNTEETLSSYEQARQAGAFIVCISSGGALAERARAGGFPLIRIPAGMPPRTALGYSAIALLGSLHAFGLVSDIRESVEETAELLSSLVLRYAAAVPEQSNKAKTIARGLHGKIVAIYASSGRLEAAAVRWRGQMEENGKNLAFHHLLPEMDHNELVGWRYPEDALKKAGVVFLRDPEDHPQVQRRFDFTREMVAESAGVTFEVWSEGKSLLARIFSLICLGDFVSLYLAHLNSVDPTPVDAIELLKQKLRA